LIAGVMLARRSRRRLPPRIAHGHVIPWTFGGIVVGGFGQASTWAGLSLWPAMDVCFLGVAILGRRLNRRDKAQP
jgi:hypothetical protein